MGANLLEISKGKKVSQLSLEKILLELFCLWLPMSILSFNKWTSKQYFLIDDWIEGFESKGDKSQDIK